MSPRSSSPRRGAIRSNCSAPWRSLRADRAVDPAYFVVVPGRKACPLAPPHHGGARSGPIAPLPGARSARMTLLIPPTSSSLRDEKHVPSLLLTTAGRDPVQLLRSLALAPRGSRC